MMNLDSEKNQKRIRRNQKESEGIGFDKSDLVYDALGIISATVIILVL